MSRKTEKTVRRTILVVVPNKEGVVVSNRALAWEWASRTGGRRVHRVEYAAPGAGVSESSSAYILDLEITCKGANRHDFTKFVRSYLPEATQHFITE